MLLVISEGNYLDCRKFVEIGCLGYLFASLCSKNVNVRTAGGHALSRFSTHLDGASFREKIQVNIAGWGKTDMII